MRNSKEYAKTIKKLLNSLNRKGPKPKKAAYDDPVEAVIYGIVSERMGASAAKVVMKRIKKYFVDFNDLRVSRNEEILEILGGNGVVFQETASTLKEVLSAIFNRYDKVSLDDLVGMGKKQARKELEQLDIDSKFVINYCFLTSLQGHAIPLTQKMIDYLKADELVHPGATDDEITGFLERRITSANAYTFYWFLRKKSETAGSKTVKKASGKRNATGKSRKKTSGKGVKKPSKETGGSATKTRKGKKT